jgi:hypothetical protein
MFLREFWSLPISWELIISAIFSTFGWADNEQTKTVMPLARNRKRRMIDDWFANGMHMWMLLYRLETQNAIITRILCILSCNYAWFNYYETLIVQYIFLSCDFYLEWHSYKYLSVISIVVVMVCRSYQQMGSYAVYDYWHDTCDEVSHLLTIISSEQKYWCI